jgi:hypothetical protein
LAAAKRGRKANVVKWYEAVLILYVSPLEVSCEGEAVGWGDVPGLERFVVKHLFTDSLCSLLTLVDLGSSGRDTVV